MNWGQSWYQHRYLAAEFLHAPLDGVVVDVTCMKNGTRRPYEHSKSVGAPHRQRYPYSELLLNSTFVFTPGGGGPHSFRFAEGLAAGAVPVVTTDLLLPFEPELDWSPCVVRVDEARIVALPSLLRAITSKETRERRAACRHMLDEVIGAEDETTFRAALRVWALRIRHAHQVAGAIGR